MKSERLDHHFILTLAVALTALGCSESPSDPYVPPVSTTDEAPTNAFLADSPWANTHRNSYNQGSTELPGPAEKPADYEEDWLPSRAGLITANFSSPYADGQRVIWASAVGQILKVDPTRDELVLIDEMEVPVDDVDGSGETITDGLDTALRLFGDQSNAAVAAGFAASAPPNPELREGEAGRGVSGIYPVLASDGIFYQPLLQKIVAYGDAVDGDRMSAIEVKREFTVPAERLQRDWDKIIGLTMLYDGRLAFATNYGLVGVVTRSFTDAKYLQITDDAGELEWVFNNIASDESGGIYVVSHERMHRVQWTGTELTLDETAGGWSAPYGTGNDNPLPVQSLAGSGSTPSLMGTRLDDDRFVVITDGEQIMNIVLFWRDAIPDDWEQLEGTDSRRIAAQVPVTFGNEEIERSFSDQSVLVRGYGAFVVNNELTEYDDTQVVNIFTSGMKGIQPFGSEKFEWDPETRTLTSVWTNDISFPNAIPTMSGDTGLIYSIGARDLGEEENTWTLEAVDWSTGASAWHLPIGELGRHNSAFAAVQVVDDRTVYYGTFFGLQRITP
ncbi:MAG: hypothetical protein ACN4G0_19175 [Polyangiales bacterium]